MKYPIRVLYLDHTTQWSGGEISLYRLLLSIDRAKVDPIVILPSEGTLYIQLQNAGIKSEIVYMHEKWLSFRKESLNNNIFLYIKYFIQYMKYAFKIKSVIQDFKIDIIHCNSLKSDIYGYFLSVITHTKCIWHIRDHIDESYLNKYVALLFKKLAFMGPDAVITNSESTKKTLFPYGARNKICNVVYDGILESDLKKDNFPEFTIWKNKIIKIGILGRIAYWKGQHVFIDAAIELKNRGFDMEYYIIGSAMFGESDYESEIVEKSKILGRNIHFLGFQFDVKPILNTLDILVHCSILPEPFGQVIIEGMAEGLPIIVSNAGGAREIIEHEFNGLRTRPGDPIDLANALQKLVEEPSFASKLGQEAFRCVRDKFSAAQSARKVELLYTDLIRE